MIYATHIMLYLIDRQSSLLLGKVWTIGIQPILYSVLLEASEKTTMMYGRAKAFASQIKNYA
jgi:hypothetical protein